MARVATIERDDFLRHYWSYNAGEHVTSIMPTGGGKTYMMCQLLQRTPVRGVMLVMKPRDPEPAEWTERLGYREIPHWPPPARWPWQEAPRGHTLWPRQSLRDLDADEDLLRDQFGRALMDVYRHGDQVVFADEVAGLCELRLQKPLKALWTRGRSMGAGLWAATQKPSGDQGGPPVPTYLYSAASHLFLGYDQTKSNRKRFAEIGGVDADLVSDLVGQLRLHGIESRGRLNYVSDQLYIRKGGPAGAYMCIITP